MITSEKNDPRRVCKFKPEEIFPYLGKYVLVTYNDDGTDCLVGWVWRIEKDMGNTWWLVTDDGYGLNVDFIHEITEMKPDEGETMFIGSEPSGIFVENRTEDMVLHVTEIHPEDIRSVTK